MISQPTHDAEAIAKLRELIQDIDTCMLTTVSAEGLLHSRPMATQRVDFDGDLWFFTSASSLKVDELYDHRQVNVSYADAKANRYVSVSGVAGVFRDRAKEEELWNPFYKAWFPKGLDDPDLVLLRITVNEAEYWDSPSSTMVHIAGFVKALLTGEQFQPGDHGKLNLPR